MNIAIFGKILDSVFFPYVQNLVDKLRDSGCGIWIYEPFYVMMKDRVLFGSRFQLFNEHTEIRGNVDLLMSMGGDGALLGTITLVRDSGIPVLGVNMGKLGFLSSISKEEVIKGIDDLLQKKYSFDRRSLLRLESDQHFYGDLNFALNDFSIYKKAPNSMITIQAYVNDDFLNSYWGDGLIISSPTGSTGYSMSCGGPIIVPGSETFVITPVATHNLTVRPIVISDNSVIRLRVEGRNDSCIICLDSRSIEVDISTDLVIRKEDFLINLVKMENQDFFKTIRKKLNWGIDVRN